MTGLLKVAGVGCGYFGQFHYEAWKRLPVQLVAICDKDLEKAKAYSKQFSVDALYSNLEDMLHERSPDILDIVLPPEQHLPAIKLALGLGVKNLICQKPFTRCLSEAETVTKAVNASDALLVIHENFRFQPWYEQIKTLVDDGTLGEIYRIHFKLRPGDGQGPDAYLDRQPYFQTMPQFLIRETAIHFVDVFRYLSGEPTRVWADLQKLNPAIAGEDAGYFIFDYDKQQRALFDGNRLSDHTAQNRRLTMGEMFIDGSRASLRLNGDGQIFTRNHGQNNEQELLYDWNNNGFGGDCVYQLQKHVVNHVVSGGPISNSVDSYLNNLKIVEAIYKSNESGKWISV